MQTIKSTLLTLFFVLLSHMLLNESKSEESLHIAVAAPVKTVEQSAVKTLAHKLDMQHVRNSSYHLDDPSSYYRSKQSRLIRALETPVR